MKPKKQQPAAKPAPTPTKPVTPTQIYEAVSTALDELHDEIYQFEVKIKDAQGALRAVEARRDHHVSKIRRLMALGDKIVDEKVRAAIIEEKWEDHLLREALAKCGGWKSLQEAGATDEEIVDRLQKWPERAGDHPLDGVAYFERGWRGYGQKKGDARNLKFYVAASNAYNAKKLFSLSGKGVVEAARRVLGIAATKPPEKKPAASAPTSTSAKKKAASKSKPAKPAITKPVASTPAKAPPTKKPKQTFNQWKATLLSILRGRFRDAPLPEQDNAGNQTTLNGLYDEGLPPGDAAERWAQLTTKNAPADDAGSATNTADKAALAADPNGTPPPDAADLEDRIAPTISLEDAGIKGETLESLKEAFSYARLQQSGTIKRVIQDAQGQDYAVMGMALRDRNQPDVFSLVPVMHLAEFMGEPATWAQRKKSGEKGRPPSLQGVRVGCEEDGESWVFVDVEAGRINVAIPKADAAKLVEDDDGAPFPAKVSEYLKLLEDKSRRYAIACWKAHVRPETGVDPAEVRRSVDLTLLAACSIDDKIKQLAHKAGIKWHASESDVPDDGDESEAERPAPRRKKVGAA